MRYSVFTSAAAGILAGALVSGAAAQSVVYEADFESPTFSTGDLNGQDGWSVNSGTAEVADSPLTAPDGSQYVDQGVGSDISRAISDTSDRILFRAYYYGTGSDVLQAPGTDTDVAAVLGFETVDVDNFTVKAYDGTADAFVAPEPAVSLDNSSWHKIIVSLNYTDQDYDIMIDDEPYLQGVDFRDAVAALNGFQATTDNGDANVDMVGFYSSPGDYDDDGISDDDEMTMSGADPLDPSKPGSSSNRGVGDFNGDDCTNLDDFLILLDNWQAVYEPIGDPALGLDDFLNLLDNWQMGAGC